MGSGEKVSEGMRMVTVAISGLHGAGKTTAAKKLAKDFELRYFSAGKIFRRIAEERDMTLEEFSSHVEEHPEIDERIDQRTAEEARKGNVLVDGRLTGWIVEDADIRILMHAPLDVRVRRIAEREGRSFEEIKRETMLREESEAKRYKELYGINVNDYSVFDLILNTESFDEKEMVQILRRAVRIKLEE